MTRQTTMASEQATAVHQMLRDQRNRAAAGPSTPLSCTQQRALAERVVESTAEPTGVTFDDAVAGSVPVQWTATRRRYDKQGAGVLPWRRLLLLLNALPPQTGRPPGKGGRLSRPQRRLPAGTRAPASRCCHRRAGRLPMAARTGHRTRPHCGRRGLGRRGDRPRTPVEGEGRGCTAPSGRCAPVALGRSRDDRGEPDVPGRGRRTSGRC